MGKYIPANKLIELVKEWRSKQMGFAWDAVNEVLKIIDSLQEEQPKDKQIVIITESHGDANIEWDCRSLDDVIVLLKSAESFITEKQIEKVAGPGSGPDYSTTEGRYSHLFKHKKEQPNNMIQWNGNNLKEVIAFTGKSPRFEEWFKSWEEFETYVHQHNNILKLFCEDGSHYEVPVGAWIVKTPDGHNIPSVSRFVNPAEWSYPYGRNETVDKLVAIAECLEMDGDCLFNGYSGTECGKFLRELARKQIGCKPTEWSEEDERIMDNCIEYIKASCLDANELYECIDWLKFRRSKPQMVYKTAIENILEMCNSCDIKRQFSAKAMDFWAGVKVKCEDALQALNESHWKPSEE